MLARMEVLSMSQRSRTRIPVPLASCLTVLLYLAVGPATASAQEPVTVIHGARVFTATSCSMLPR